MTDAVILIVEDDADLRSTYLDWLSAAYRVRVAEDATTALERFDGAVDLVLLDRRLPDRYGERILPLFKNRHPECRVAIVSAVEPDWDVLEMDFDAYLEKPVRKRELLEFVECVLNENHHGIADLDDTTL